jgi:glycosyltransferase involved in cell wall biosynthesis
VIVQVVAPGAIGGLETVVAALLTAAAQHHSPMACVALLAPDAPVPHALANAAAAAGVPVVRVLAPHRAYRAQYRALRDALRQVRATLVHSHGYHADVLTAISARSLGIAHMSTLHGFVGGTRRSRAYEWLQLRALRGARAVVGVSAPIVSRTISSGVSADRVHLVPNAAPQIAPLSRDDARSVLGLDRSTRAIAWVGRFSAEKHPRGFLDVLEALPAEPPVVGVMIGDGPLLAPIREQGDALLQRGRLVLAGSQPSAGRLLPAFDALLITSTTEGTPMVALEAMLAGVPVISTAVGGVPTLLDDGRAGLLVPAGEPAPMVRSLSQVLDNPELARCLVAAARTRVATDYSSEVWWARYAALYASN